MPDAVTLEAGVDRAGARPAMRGIEHQLAVVSR
jgi:hypothetical protein